MKSRYYMDQSDRYVIENYNFTKPFSSFLPGVAGIYGKPLWSFYVNRGQGICAFGVEQRENMIMEFIPADQAYQRSLLSFRTFYKVNQSTGPVFYEPFRAELHSNSIQRMSISAADVRFEDIHTQLGLKTEVTFCTLPNDAFPALMRKLTISNTGDQPLTLDIVDGLPRLMPFGMNEFFCKNMSRTSEAWMGVENLYEQGVPFYKLKVIPLDEAKVQTLEKGNFFCCFDSRSIITPIVDPGVVFGPNTDFSYPYHFYKPEPFVFPSRQITDNRTPCAMFHYQLTLAPNTQTHFYQIVGQMDSLSALQSQVSRISNSAFFKSKQSENQSIIRDVESHIRTVTQSAELDAYTGQTYLDNVLRGGLPITLAKNDQKAVSFYVYSRKHGDLERDYNKFSIAPTYYSQGNGNYRDVNQNRRSDIFFNPDLGDETIIQMMNLIQLDGYNPLIIRGKQFVISDETLRKSLIHSEYAGAVLGLDILKSPFTPGSLYEALLQEGMPIFHAQNLFSKLILAAESLSEAEHGEGFWSDHWHYNLDLIERYLTIYPDKVKALFLDTKAYEFYDDCYEVLPRSERYNLTESGLRQTRFVQKNKSKETLIAKRKIAPHAVRIKNGKGTVYTTTLAVKLLHLILVKACNMDPDGSGIELEAGKPNWYDAINGLPALFGSSTSESFELVRWAKFLKEQLAGFPKIHVNLPTELYDLYTGLGRILAEYPQSPQPDFIYWDKSNTLKEAFREKTVLGLAGTEHAVSTDKICAFLDELIARLATSLDRTRDPQTGVFQTYFRFVAESFETDPHTQKIKVTQFRKMALPLFLEGPVHRMKLVQTPAEAFDLYQGIRSSALFDAKLGMYKVNASLANEPLEIGRNKVFTPGWLENESIWLHMEYKYLLELLRSGLNKEFEETLKTICIAFQDPERYGRSILENSSFIASSANPDEAMHGQGFVARLSGSTAEWIHIWILMFFGQDLFGISQTGELTLTFTPKIPGWFFTAESKPITYTLTDGTLIQETLSAGAVLVNFLGKIPVIIHNSARTSTWEASIQKIVLHPLQGDPIAVIGNTIVNAGWIRALQVNKIEIWF